MLFQISIRKYYAGSGEISVTCCDTDFCNIATTIESTGTTESPPVVQNYPNPTTTRKPDPIHPLEMEDEIDLVRNSPSEPSRLEANIGGGSSSKLQAENAGSKLTDEIAVIEVALMILTFFRV